MKLSLQLANYLPQSAEIVVIVPGGEPNVCCAACWKGMREYNNANNNSQEGSSCAAIKKAVCCLHSLDDLFTEKLASGFYANVFKVIRKKDGKAMVLKVNKVATERKNFMREIGLMRSLHHPNVIKLEGVCVHKAIVQALIEFANGGCLEGLIKTRPPNQLDALKIAYDISRGMKYLHDQGIIHRDLTSKNIFIKVSGMNKLTALVADLGLAVKVHDISEFQSLGVVGSAYWMAPECLRQRPYNNKADVFSFGVIFCEMIGWVPADPDYLTRDKDFGINFESFVKSFEQHPCLLKPSPPSPSLLLLLKFCCQVNPGNRPNFAKVCIEVSLLRTRFLKGSIVEELNKFSKGDNDLTSTLFAADDLKLKETNENSVETTMTQKIFDSIWDNRILQEHSVYAKRNSLVY